MSDIHEIAPEIQIEILEKLKPKLGRFFEENVYQWGLSPEDCRLVDEAGFGYTGIPIFGPELLSDKPHIDIAVKVKNYFGPQTDIEHPLKVNLPGKLAFDISEEYGIAVWDFIKASDSFLNLPTEVVQMGNIEVLVPEPCAHIREFASETILYYSVKQVGEEKLQEWFDKLVMIRNVSQKLGKLDVFDIAEEMILASRERAKREEWSWLKT